MEPDALLARLPGELEALHRCFETSNERNRA
jgi:hypothetical protein